MEYHYSLQEERLVLLQNSSNFNIWYNEFKEYDDDENISEIDFKERLLSQRRQVKKKLGLDIGGDSLVSELVQEDDVKINNLSTIEKRKRE